MALPLTPDQRQALRGPVAIRILVDLYLDSGRYSFWDGDAHAAFNGATYLSAAAVGGVSPISLGQDLGAEGITLTLDGTRLLEIAGDPRDPAEVLGTFEDENYQQRAVDVSYAFFSMETQALILVQRRFAGLIDQAPIQERPPGDDGPGAVILTINCESLARRYGRRVGRLRSHDDQQEIWPGDDFYKFKASTLANERNLLWGRKGDPSQGGAFSGGDTRQNVWRGGSIGDVSNGRSSF